VLALIDEQHYQQQKTTQMKNVYRLYAIEGKPYRVIEDETRIPKGTICGYMKEIELLTNEHIIRFEKGKSQTRNLLAKTRIVRKSTNRCVSAFGWASLRSTFCRLAIENGVDPKVIMLAVGHKNYNTTMTFYNNPTMEHQKQLWLKHALFRSHSSHMTREEARKVLVSTLSPTQIEALKVLGVSIGGEDNRYEVCRLTS
jgi:integrase